LAQCMGMPMDTPRPSGCFDSEMKRVACAAKSAGKIAAGIFTTPEALHSATEMGYSMIVCCADAGLLATGSGQSAKMCREALGQPE
jgi:2-keto-3-deoxy-L-rhamnonate aldolase RhmA